LAHGKTVKQQKADAKALISKLFVLPVLPGASQILAKGLVDVDPMGYFTEPQHYSTPVYPGPTRAPTMPVNPVAAVTEVINNPAITITPALVKVINDPKKMITPTGEIVKVPKIQFQEAALYPPVGRRTRKKTPMDRTMSKCLKMSNSKARLKNGSMKKGWSQARIMKEAHRLCRKHG
jgi:hypothetical protein